MSLYVTAGAKATNITCHYHLGLWKRRIIVDVFVSVHPVCDNWHNYNVSMDMSMTLWFYVNFKQYRTFVFSSVKILTAHLTWLSPKQVLPLRPWMALVLKHFSPCWVLTQVHRENSLISLLLQVFISTQISVIKTFQ